MYVKVVEMEIDLFISSENGYLVTVRTNKKFLYCKLGIRQFREINLSLKHPKSNKKKFANTKNTPFFLNCTKTISVTGLLVY